MITFAYGEINSKRVEGVGDDSKCHCFDNGYCPKNHLERRVGQSIRSSNTHDVNIHRLMAYMINLLINPFVSLSL